MSDNSFLTKLLESNGYLIAHIGSESHRRFARFIEQQGFGMYQQAVLTTLIELGGHGAASQRQLGEFMGVDPRNLVSVIDALEQRSLVERVAQADDRRRFVVRLTDEGKVLAERIRTAAQAMEEEMFACLDSREKEALHVSLLKLYASLEN